MDPVKVAAVQAAPVLLDRDETIAKVVALAEKAATEGARLVAFPEAFVPGYPDWVWRTRPWDADATALYARLFDQAVVVGSPATDLLAETAGRLGIWLSVGVRPGHRRLPGAHLGQLRRLGADPAAHRPGGPNLRDRRHLLHQRRRPARGPARPRWSERRTFWASRKWTRLDFKLLWCGRLWSGVLDSEPEKGRWNREIREPRERRTDWKRRWILPGGETPCPGSAGHRESRRSLAGLVSIRAAQKLRA